MKKKTKKNLITNLNKCFQNPDTKGIHIICHELYEKNPHDSLLDSMLDYYKGEAWSFTSNALFNRSVCLLLLRLCNTYNKEKPSDEYPDIDIMNIQTEVTHFLEQIFVITKYDKIMIGTEINV